MAALQSYGTIIWHHRHHMAPSASHGSTTWKRLKEHARSPLRARARAHHWQEHGKCTKQCSPAPHPCSGGWCMQCGGGRMQCTGGVHMQCPCGGAFHPCTQVGLKLHLPSPLTRGSNTSQSGPRNAIQEDGSAWADLNTKPLVPPPLSDPPPMVPLQWFESGLEDPSCKMPPLAGYSVASLLMLHCLTGVRVQYCSRRGPVHMAGEGGAFKCMHGV